MRALKRPKIIMRQIGEKISTLSRIEMNLGYASGEARPEIGRDRSGRKWIIPEHDHVGAMLNRLSSRITRVPALQRKPKDWSEVLRIRDFTESLTSSARIIEVENIE